MRGRPGSLSRAAPRPGQGLAAEGLKHGTTRVPAFPPQLRARRAAPSEKSSGGVWVAETERSRENDSSPEARAEGGRAVRRSPRVPCSHPSARAARGPTWKAGLAADHAPCRHGLPSWELLADFPKPRRGRAPGPDGHSPAASRRRWRGAGGGGGGPPGARGSRRERGAASPLPLSTSASPPAASRSRCRPRPNPAPPALSALPPNPCPNPPPRYRPRPQPPPRTAGLAPPRTRSRPRAGALAREKDPNPVCPGGRHTADATFAQVSVPDKGATREGGPLTPCWSPGAASGLVVEPRLGRPFPVLPGHNVLAPGRPAPGLRGRRAAPTEENREAGRAELLGSTWAVALRGGNAAPEMEFQRRKRPEGPRATHRHVTTVHLTLSDLLLSTFFLVFSNLS